MTLGELESKLNRSLDSMDCVDLLEDGRVHIDGTYGAADIERILYCLINRDTCPTTPKGTTCPSTPIARPPVSP